MSLLDALRRGVSLRDRDLIVECEQLAGGAS